MGIGLVGEGFCFENFIIIPSGLPRPASWSACVGYGLCWASL